jgi:hypothetical protein
MKLKWVENGRPGCGYNNVTAYTPFGEILITWKGWKDYLNFCVDEPGWLAGKMYSMSTLEDTQKWCEAEYFRLLTTAQEALR